MVAWFRDESAVERAASAHASAGRRVEIADTPLGADGFFLLVGRPCGAERREDV
ncbi:MAG: hypothetical protein QM621_08105 [Aeromicrobium sp.]|uniref:hypothetical protein n=1 Tax=Aeromicrobium sp. TaxID=1871063 RepID=UPI0039E717E3